VLFKQLSQWAHLNLFINNFRAILFFSDLTFFDFISGICMTVKLAKLLAALYFTVEYARTFSWPLVDVGRSNSVNWPAHHCRSRSGGGCRQLSQILLMLVLLLMLLLLFATMMMLMMKLVLLFCLLTTIAEAAQMSHCRGGCGRRQIFTVGRRGRRCGQMIFGFNTVEGGGGSGCRCRCGHQMVGKLCFHHAGGGGDATVAAVRQMSKIFGIWSVVLHHQLAEMVLWMIRMEGGGAGDGAAATVAAAQGVVAAGTARGAAVSSTTVHRPAQ
jgi:hypothetical protein